VFIFHSTTEAIESVQPSYERLSGKDRFEVAVNVAEKGWGTTGAGTVLVANYNAYADALAAGPLAYHKNAPILLTHTSQLTPASKNEIAKLQSNEVIVVGGPGSVSEDVLNELKEMGIENVQRIGGKDRFEVALNIAKELPPSNTAIVAFGLNFPDALAISPYASVKGYPILLTNTYVLPATTIEALSLRNVKQTIVVGGEGSVSPAVFSSLPQPYRIGGNDRYAVAANIVREFNVDTNRTYLATGLTFADALTGSVLAAREKAPILLTNGNKVPEDSLKIVREKKINSFTILGGESSVPEPSGRLLFEQNNPAPVVYLVPHADDEVLTYAVNIRNEISKGREVFIALMARGDDTFARDALNGFYDKESYSKYNRGKIVYCYWHGKYHDPENENFKHGHIDLKEFGDIRVEEFIRAGKALGVPDDHILVEGLPRGAFNAKRVKDIITVYKTKYPNAEFRTMSKHDLHNEHALIGRVLDELVNENKIPKHKVLYFVSNYTDRTANKKFRESVYKESLLKPKDRLFIVDSIKVYKDYRPSLGLYAAGYHSVSSQFNSLENDIYTKFHY
jgi:putative cell wall-binding protein/LmbE family N-acetylglucosaminyl deacetylase